MLVAGSVLFVLLLLVLLVVIPMMFRVVVPTNEVHIVQTGKSTVSYGKDHELGNSYYKWPTWIPKLGVERTILPVSNFEIELKAYEAYDIGRLPFVVDITAFFRIENSNLAAQRVSSVQELESQLVAIVQGAVRTVLATNEIEEIMQGRGKFSLEFTDEVSAQLKNWGVVTVKNIELMDIRDSRDSSVIANIMEKKKSQIEMESRQEVAKNKKIAEVAEIEATREIDLQKQEAEQQVGMRTVEAQREVELARQAQAQQVKEQEKLTKEKEMAVKKVEETRRAEIDKEVEVVKANQQKETAIIIAEGDLEKERKKAEGIKLNGEAQGDADQAVLMAPVKAQIALAEKISESASYQEYLVRIAEVQKEEVVGKVQAEALKAAKINVVANAGNPTDGVKNVMELFTTPKGGTSLGTMLLGLKNTEVGKELLSSLTEKDKDK